MGRGAGGGGQRWREDACLDCGGYIAGGWCLRRCPPCIAERGREMNRERRRAMRFEEEGACQDCGGYIAGGMGLLRCPPCKEAWKLEWKRRRQEESAERRRAFQTWE